MGQPVCWLIPGLGEIFPQPNFLRQNPEPWRPLEADRSPQSDKLSDQAGGGGQKAQGPEHGSFLEHLYLKIFFFLGKKK